MTGKEEKKIERLEKDETSLVAIKKKTVGAL